MRASEQWALIERELGEWDEARLAFTPEGPVADAAAVLAPLQPGRVGSELRIHVSRSGGGPERLRNVLRRLDRKRVWGQLSLVEGIAAAAAASPGASPELTPSLAAGWDATVAALPPDWSDLLCELMLGASDLVPRAALLGAPLNPTRNPDTTALRFRISGKQGYGASPGDGAAVLRAHGRGGDNGPDHCPERTVGHGERRHAGPGLARRGPLRLSGRGRRSPLASPSGRSWRSPACPSRRADRRRNGASRLARASPSTSAFRRT